MNAMKALCVMGVRAGEKRSVHDRTLPKAWAQKRAHSEDILEAKKTAEMTLSSAGDFLEHGNSNPYAMHCHDYGAGASARFLGGWGRRRLGSWSGRGRALVRAAVGGCACCYVVVEGCGRCCVTDEGWAAGEARCVCERLLYAWVAQAMTNIAFSDSNSSGELK